MQRALCQQQCSAACAHPVQWPVRPVPTPLARHYGRTGHSRRVRGLLAARKQLQTAGRAFSDALSPLPLLRLPAEYSSCSARSSTGTLSLQPGPPEHLTYTGDANGHCDDKVSLKTYGHKKASAGPRLTESQWSTQRAAARVGTTIHARCAASSVCSVLMCSQCSRTRGFLRRLCGPVSGLCWHT